MFDRFSMNKRKLGKSEKFLAVTLSLCMIPLLIASQTPHIDPDIATPEVTCQNIVRALAIGNDKGLEKLTTPQGFAALQKARSDERFGSQPKVAQRIFNEWGTSIYWYGVTPDREGKFSMAGVAKYGKTDGAISFQQTRNGWKLDGYEPRSGKNIRGTRSSVGSMWNLK